VPGVVALHDVHVWSIAPRFPALSAHVELRDVSTPSRSLPTSPACSASATASPTSPSSRRPRRSTRPSNAVSRPTPPASTRPRPPLALCSAWRRGAG
jgi:hypothetical protein